MKDHQNHKYDPTEQLEITCSVYQLIDLIWEKSVRVGRDQAQIQVINPNYR